MTPTTKRRCGDCSHPEVAHVPGRGCFRCLAETRDARMRFSAAIAVIHICERFR